MNSRRGAEKEGRRRDVSLCRRHPEAFKRCGKRSVGWFKRLCRRINPSAPLLSSLRLCVNQSQ